MKLNEAEMRMAYQIEATSQSAALNEIYMTWRYAPNRAVITAQGPGTAETGMPASAHCRTKSSPGSEMAGEPASDTRAQTSPA